MLAAQGHRQEFGEAWDRGWDGEVNAGAGEVGRRRKKDVSNPFNNKVKFLKKSNDAGKSSMPKRSHKVHIVRR